MLDDTKIVQKVDSEKLSEKIGKYGKDKIECSFHTFFRLSERQRKLFTCEEIRNILLNERLFLAGIQKNGNHALFYRHQGKIVRIMLNIDRKVKIVTFYFIEEWQIPKI